MWLTAHHAHMLEHARDFGFDVSVNGHAWSDVKKKRDAYIQRLNEIYQNNLDKRDVTLIKGEAKFLDATTIAVGEQQYLAEKIVIATGGFPITPGIHGAEYGIRPSRRHRACPSWRTGLYKSCRVIDLPGL